MGGRDRSRSPLHRRDSDRSRGRDYDRIRDRETERDRIRDRETERDRIRDRETERDRIRDRETERDRSRDREKDHRRDRDRRHREKRRHRRSKSPRDQQRARAEDRCGEVIEIDDDDVIPVSMTTGSCLSSRGLHEESIPLTVDDFVEEPVSENQMMREMGFKSFSTTKGKGVKNNDQGAVHVVLKRRYRQYMNRRGGFNRPLEFVL